MRTFNRRSKVLCHTVVDMAFPPAPSSSRSDKYRDNCLAAYDPPQQHPETNHVKCLVLNDRFEPKLIKASHIYQQQWPDNILVSKNRPAI